jgi:hypothetical protein
MNHLIRKAIIRSTALVLLLLLATGNLSQSTAAEEKGPEIIVKGISFLVREIPSTPSPLKILETHVEVYNKSREATAPANSIKLVLVPIESKYAEGDPGSKFDPGVQETTIAVPLPPVTGRIMTFGFSLPEKLPESMTFEIQINPPEGEKKTATWKSGKN